MSRLRYPPRRSLRSEIIPLASVVALSLAVIGLFPDGVFGFRTRESPPASARGDAAGCAFVWLTPAEEAAALAAARTSWQSQDRSSRRRLEMLPTELPEDPPAPAIDLRSRPPARIDFRIRPQARLLPPTMAAPRPVRIGATESAPPRQAFPREVMLRFP